MAARSSTTVPPVDPWVRPRAAGAAAVVCALGIGVALVATWPARAADARDAFIRRCSTQPSGASLPAGFKASSVTVGPLSLYSFGQVRANGRRSTAPASRFAPVRPGRYRVDRLWAVLPPGQWATVTVPSGERRSLSLVYDPSLWNSGGWTGIAPVARGDAKVTFRACARPEAQGSPPHVVYDGGLLAAGARCARLQVLARGWRKPRTVVVALGRKRC